MKLEAILHIPKSNYAYAYSNRELHIRLRTAKNDVTQAAVYIAKKHEWLKKEKLVMRKAATDRLFDYYQYNYITDDPRIGYYFEIADGKTTLVYCESGIMDTFDDENSYFHYFQYPYINGADVLKPPEWISDAIFYQIFVERFRNGGSSINSEQLRPWGERPKPESFYGGDLQGVIDKLDYLRELGINGIYLTPVFASPSNHKYDTTDYRAIDSAFGSKSTLCRLVSKAHEKGIRVVLDGVFNHCGVLFAPFQDVLKNGADSYYRDWFHIKSFPVTTDPVTYNTFGTSANMPKLNTSNPDLKKYLLDTVAYWTKETGIDGWRLDVSDEIDHCFWRDFRSLVKSINKDAIIIGENWHCAFPWLMGDQFDSVMNYPVTKLCIEFFARGEIDAQSFASDLYGSLMWNYDQVNYAMFNLLDSHDTMRFLTWCGGDKRKFKLAVLFLFSYVGIPCTYYGSEIGTEGKGDPDCRRTFDWDESHWDKELYAFYKSVISLRKELKPLRSGGISMYAKDGVFFLERSLKEEKTITVLNNSGLPKKVELVQHAEDLLHKGDLEERNGKTVFTLKPFHGGIYRIISDR